MPEAALDNLQPVWNATQTTSIAHWNCQNQTIFTPIYYNNLLIAFWEMNALNHLIDDPWKMLQ